MSSPRARVCGRHARGDQRRGHPSLEAGGKIVIMNKTDKEHEVGDALAESLRRLRYEVIPLGGVEEAIVIAGDAEGPAGKFEGAAALLGTMAEIGHDLEEVGISGYPESHPLISDETTIQAMYDKAPYATYIVSQICFDP